jgi:hypothetical protein
LAREAVALADETDFLVLRGDAYLDLAEVLLASGREGDARAAVERALEFFERKENVVSAEQARSLLAA